MTTLLESGAKPYRTKKGIVISLGLHAALITGAVIGTAKVVLPPREKVEEHPILYVASPPPPPVHVAPDPLPEVKQAPRPKAPAPAPRVQAPRPVAPRPTPQPATPALVAPTNIPVNLPAINPNAIPTVSDVVASRGAEPTIAAAPVSRSVGGDEGGAGGRAGGLGSGSAGKAFDENEVDRAVQVSRQTPPRYPDALRSVGVAGSVAVRFIVGADGKVEPGSIQIIDSPHRLFSDAVRSSLLASRYRPAEAGGRPVRQLVEQSFAFKLQT